MNAQNKHCTYERATLYFDYDFKRKRNKENRHFSLSYAKRALPNGTFSERDWLIFSPHLGAVLCFTCKLFGKSSQNIETFRNDGFNDWKHYKRAFETHEQSKHHAQNYIAYKSRAIDINTLDAEFLKQESIEVRVSLVDEKLNNLTLCCIEREILKSMDFDDIIDTFINAKIRKINI